MKSTLLTIFFFAAIATAKCETPATTTTKTDVKTEQAATTTTVKAILVGTNDLNLKLIREGVKAA